MNCEKCDNKERREIVPKKYTKGDKNLCVPCFNMNSFQWGEPYLCSKCSMSQLRMANILKCHSCENVDKMVKILKVRRLLKKDDYKNRSIKFQALEQLKNKIYSANYAHLSKYYNFTDEERCPVMMCDIPEDLVKFCMNGRHTYDEIVEEAERYARPELTL